METIEITTYLEKIRYEKNMSQADFCRGIVSIRQYQRYKIGLSEISHEKTEQFAERLGINYNKLLSDFENEKKYQLNQINLFHNAIANKDYNSAKRYKAKINTSFILSERGKKYYEYTMIVQNYYDKKITKSKMISLLSNLIKYPKILDSNYLDDIEVLCLSFLLNVLSESEEDKVLIKLSQIFDNADSVMSVNSEYIYTLILLRLARHYGLKRNFNKVILYCDLGIERGKEFRQYYLWCYFYYYKSLAYFAQGNIYEYEDSLLNCYNILMLEKNDSKTRKFLYLIEKDYKIDFHKFVIEVVKKRKLIKNDSFLNQ
jgi:transcriptional regulator with XRE-family HTH domain